MKIEIDAAGDHTDHAGKRMCHMVVDRIGCLVDLTGVHGPLDDPNVLLIKWGPYGKESEDMGYLIRRSSNNVTERLDSQPFTQLAMLQGYLAAFNAKLASQTAH